MRTACPNCGYALHPVVLYADSAPWLCDVCCRGWFVAELTQPTTWVKMLQCHTYEAWPALSATLDQEVAAARTRGTSVIVDQVGLLALAQLTWLAARLAKVPGAAVLVAALDAAIAKGGA